MTRALSTPDRERLVKLLGMLGSSFQGERDAAACAAQRLLEQHGLTWCQVIAPAAADATRPAPGDWRQVVQACLQRRHFLSRWEIGFLESLSQYPRLSLK